MKCGLFIVSFCAISGVAIVGCSAASEPIHNGDFEAGPPRGPADAGIADVKAVTALAPNVFLVNAATSLGDVRICFEPNAEPALPADAIVPQTNYPGLPAGASAFFRNSSTLNGKSVTPFAVSASGLGSAEYGRAMFTCSELSTNPLINRIPIGSITIDVTAPTILALVGCPAGVGDAARCGPTFDLGKGNLEFKQVPISGTLVQDGNLGAFVLNLSPSLKANLTGMASSHLGSLASPCSGTMIDQSSLVVGTLYPPAARSVVRPTTFDAEGFAVCIQKNQMAVSLVARSYAQVQRATVPTSLPGDHFGKQADFVFTIVGDTTVQSGPESAHVLAIAFGATGDP